MSDFSDFNKSVQDYATQGFTEAEEVLANTLKRIHRAGRGNGTNLIYAAILQAGAALNYLSIAMAKGSDPQEKLQNSTKETMLVAGLLVARAVLPIKGGIKSDFSPRQVIAAIEAAKLVSSNPDIEHFIDQKMLSVYREGCEEKNLTYGYWDYLPDVGPSFDGMSESLVNYTKH